MFLNLTVTPKIAPKAKTHPEGPQKVAPQLCPKMWGYIKNEKIGLYFQNQRRLSTNIGSKKAVEPDPHSRNSPKGPKKYKKGPNFGGIKNTSKTNFDSLC